MAFFKNYDCITFKKTEFSSEEELNKALEKMRFYPSDGGMEYGVYFQGRIGFKSL
ncbi:MAG: hypothetical protein V8S74_11120 [Lachnospirales bacterium]